MHSKSNTLIEFLVPDDPAFCGTKAQAGARNIDSSELQERIGIDPVIADIYPGVEVRCQIYPCRLGENFVFGVVRGIEDDAEGRVEIWAHRADQIALVELALDLPDGWFDWRSNPDPAIEQTWRAVRQDDNGNSFELARFVQRDDADLYVKLWADRAGAHKQTALVLRS